MDKPIRIQRKRTKGFNLQAQSPDGRPVVSVCRPGKWGNPYIVHLNGTPQACVDQYRGWVLAGYRLPFTREEMREELAGKHLACWCALDAPCHASILLELANA